MRYLLVALAVFVFAVTVVVLSAPSSPRCVRGQSPPGIHTLIVVERCER